jgi:hypothetical protein
MKPRKYQSAFFFFAFALSFSILSCEGGAKIGEHSTMTSVPKNVIVIGAGGGFSGFYDGFLLAKNGNVYSWRSHTDTPDTLTLICTISKDSARFFFSYLGEISFRSLESGTPGNMNSFIELRTEEESHRVRWSADNPANIPELSLFYSLLRKQIDRSVARAK